MQITKDQSSKIKGIAILFMLFLHLFNSKERLIEHDVTSIIGSTSFLYEMSKFTGICVSMFLFISGYGLKVSYLKDQNYLRNNILRIGMLISKYWVILILATGLGYIIAVPGYPGSIRKFATNLLLIYEKGQMYNGEWWFLQPFVIISLVSGFIFAEFNLQMQLNSG